MKAFMLAFIAVPLVTGPGTGFYAGMPPERFRVVASVRLAVAAPADLPRLCGTEVPPGLTLKGCARKDFLGRRLVIIADPCLRGEIEETARILCHEISHAAGAWPADHPL